MPTLASSIIGWLWPSRSQSRSLVCHGTAHQIAQRLIVALGIQSDHYAPAYQHHLTMVVLALRGTGRTVTRQTVVEYTPIPFLKELEMELSVQKETWLRYYIEDLDRSFHGAIDKVGRLLAARLEVTSAPKEQVTLTYLASVVIGCLFDLLLQLCFALVWVASIVICAAVFWLALDRLTLAGLIGHSLSAAQCLGFGLLVVFLFNELTGRTDARARRVVSGLAAQL